MRVRTVLVEIDIAAAIPAVDRPAARWCRASRSRLVREARSAAPSVIVIVIGAGQDMVALPPGDSADRDVVAARRSDVTVGGARRPRFPVSDGSLAHDGHAGDADGPLRPMGVTHRLSGTVSI